MKNDGLSILFAISFGRMQQFHWQHLNNKNNTL